MLIVIAGRLPGMNEVIEKNRGGWKQGAKTKKSYTEWCRAHFFNALRTGTGPIKDKVDVHITFYESNHRRDHDNVLSGALKPILDGAVKAGFLPDDSQRYIGDIYSHIEVDKGNERVEVRFEPARNNS